MKISITLFATDRGMHPTDLAQAVESRGFDGLFLPEHSHIPVSRRTVWPGSRPGRTDPLPDYYAHLHDQIVALSMAAAVTRRISLGTSVTLVPQHDPVWLAKQIATLDYLSNGRVILGIGFGWNVEQGETHGVKFAQRRQRTAECVAIMRSLWHQDVAEYRGEQLTLEPAWAYPKPHPSSLAQGGPPVFIGGMGPRTYKAIARYADGWMPITQRNSLAGRIEPLHTAFAQQGRAVDTLRIIVSGATENPEGLAQLKHEGVEQVCLTVWPETQDQVMSELDRLATVAEQARKLF